MRKYVHKVLADSIANIFGISGSEKKALLRVVVELDRLKKYREHHSERSFRRVLDHTLYARRDYLSGDLRSCVRNLGIALHLAQDAVVPSASRRRRYLHNRLEAAVEYVVRKRNVEKDLRQVLMNLGYPHTVYYNALVPTLSTVVFEKRDHYSAYEAYESMVKLTAMIAHIVFSFKFPPSEFMQELDSLNSEVLRWKEKLKTLEDSHERYVKKALTIFIVGLAISLPTAFWLPFAAAVSFAAAVTFSIHVLKSDKEFYETKRQYEEALNKLIGYKNYIREWYILPEELPTINP